MSFLTLLLALTVGAGAHPFGADYYSLRTSVKLADRGLMVIVGVEVPNQNVLAEFKERYADVEKIRERHQAEFREMMWDRVADGIHLQVNGEPVKVEFKPVAKDYNGRGGEQFFVYMVGTTFPDPEQRWGDHIRLDVDVDCFQVPSIYLSSYTTVEAPWTLDSTSASALIGEHATSPDATSTDAWTMDPAMRHVELVFSRTR